MPYCRRNLHPRSMRPFIFDQRMTSAAGMPARSFRRVLFDSDLLKCRVVCGFALPATPPGPPLLRGGMQFAPRDGSGRSLGHDEGIHVLPRVIAQTGDVEGLDC